MPTIYPKCHTNILCDGSSKEFKNTLKALYNQGYQFFSGKTYNTSDLYGSCCGFSLYDNGEIKHIEHNIKDLIIKEINSNIDLYDGYIYYTSSNSSKIKFIHGSKNNITEQYSIEAVNFFEFRQLYKLILSQGYRLNSDYNKNHSAFRLWFFDSVVGFNLYEGNIFNFVYRYNVYRFNIFLDTISVEEYLEAISN